MARYERVAQIVGLLSAASGPLSLEHLCRDLDASSATVKRLVRFMREDLHIPVGYDRGAGGYRIEGAASASFTGHAGLAPHERLLLRAGFDLLGQVAPGLFGAIAAIVLAGTGPPADDAPVGRARLRVHRPRVLAAEMARLRSVALALLGGHRLHLRTRALDGHAGFDHVVSPQRLLLHRGHWHLIAWCHASRHLRLFPVQRIESATGVPVAAERIEEAVIDATFDAGYGLAAGTADAIAELHFAAHVAREAGEEAWHPLQSEAWHADGSLTLRFPFGDATELVGDLLRWGASVEVIGPSTLRRRVVLAHAEAAHRYGS